MLTILDPQSLAILMREIVSACHSLTDTAGERVNLPTMTAAVLRQAALNAIQHATSHTVWGGDERLVIKRPRPVEGALSIEG